MNYAKIENGVVTNIIIADAEVIESFTGMWVDAAGAGIGDAYVNGEFVKPWMMVSPRQIRQALTAAGLRTQVEAAVAAGDQDLKDWWEFSTAVERNHPMVIAMATGLGVSESQLDDLFKQAATL